MQADFTPQSPVYLERRDHDRHMSRFYALHLAPTLFGGCDLVREWGRIGSPGTLRRDAFETEAEATLALQAIEQKKRRKGYCPFPAR